MKDFKLTDEEVIQPALLAWQEWKHPAFRTWDPKPSDAKRLWAVALSSQWAGNGRKRLDYLHRLLPKAIETAARTSAFISARTGFWHICREPEGLRRLSQGITVGMPLEVYDEQVLRVRMDQRSIVAIRALAAGRGITPSALVAEVLDAWIEHRYTFEAGQ